MANNIEEEGLYEPYAQACIGDFMFYYKDCPTWNGFVRTFVVVWNIKYDKKVWNVHGWYNEDLNKFVFPFNPDDLPNDVESAVNLFFINTILPC